MTTSDREYGQGNSTDKLRSGKMPALLRQVHNNSFAVLENKFNSFFKACDDLFFGLASKAKSNNEQNLYFETIREIRDHRNLIWRSFDRNFKQQFTDLLKAQPKSSTLTTSELQLDQDEISLVDKDDMEQDVVSSGIVHRARHTHQESLYQLSCRMQFLLPDASLSEQNNPMDPGQIVAGFNLALEQLRLNLSCKIILLKQFEASVVQELNEVYSLSNELLIKAGILPQISPHQPTGRSTGSAEVGDGTSQGTPQAGQSPGGTAAAGMAGPGAPQPGYGHSHGTAGGIPTAGAVQGYQVPDNIQQYLGRLRQSGLQFTAGVSSGSSGVTVATDDLLTALHQQQLSNNYQTAGYGAMDLGSTVRKILASNRECGKGDRLQTADEDIINLVSMFFDFVLDDRNLPIAFQALIGRLQIPILKVALKDKQFFSSVDHPARRLVNGIANAAMGWDQAHETEQDNLYQSANTAVAHVIKSFNGDLVTFTQALAMFQSNVSKDENKAQVLEQRTRQAAMGKAKAEFARNECNQTLLQRLKESLLPEYVLNFLVKDWHKVMLYTQLTHGSESKQWLDAKQVIDQLVWALRPHTDLRSLERLQRIKKDILDQVKQGLVAVSTLSETSDATLQAIDGFLNAVLNQQLIETELTGLQPEHLAALGALGNGATQNWQQLSSAEQNQLKQNSLDKEYQLKARRITPGTWFDYSSPESEKSFRCKLALVTTPGDVFIFVNRFGLRVFDKKIEEFAADLQRGLASPLDSGVLFERALDNISEKLKNLAG